MNTIQYKEYPQVVVGVLTYNHQNYIKECLESVCFQNGNFRLKIIICDDKSTDATAEKISNFIENFDKNKNVEFYFVSNPVNLGVVKNLKNLLNLSKGCDFLTFCEGDDYWLDCNRIKYHIDFLQRNPRCSLSFNSIIIYDEASKTIQLHETQKNFTKEVFQTNALVEENFIGNFSCCFYNASFLHLVPDSLFELFTVDWFFNIYYSTFGHIGFLKRPMTLYRQHSSSVWSSLEPLVANKKLIEYIDQYNNYFNFLYDKEFTAFKDRLLVQQQAFCSEKLDLTPDVVLMETAKVKDSILKKLLLITKVWAIKTKKIVWQVSPPIVISVIKLLVPPFIVASLRKISRS